jgi:outer membrane protein assembly factor BamB
MLILPLYAQNPDEWPIQFNTHCTGHSETTVLKPPLKMKWVTKIQGNVQGPGPVVAEGKVVVQDLGGYLFCLDAETGELLWRQFIKLVGEQCSTPCIWNGRVYANFCNRGDADATGMRCFDLNTGELLWKGTGGFIIPRQHYSPAVSNGKLFFACVRDNNQTKYNESPSDWQAQVIAWDALTGDSLWIYTLFDGITQTYPNYTIHCNTSVLVVNDTVYASYGDYDSQSGKTVALDLNGNVLWSSTQHFISHYVGQMQYLQGKLIIPEYKSPHAIKILSTSDWSVLLTDGGGHDYSKISALMNGKYWNRGYSDKPSAYDMSTGQLVLTATTYNDETFQTGCSPAATANGYVYQGFGSAYSPADNGQKWYAWNESGNPVWSYQTTHNACNPMAIAYGRLYTVEGGDALVYCWENDN